MRYIIILALLLAMTINALAIPPLSDQSKISLLTCSPGNELYSLYGHSAIRVADPVLGIDIVFNYGTFDFDTPNFYLKFAKGELNYLLVYNKYSRFLREYEYYKRSVYEEELNITTAERQKLFDALMENAKPENRAYRYDFLFDNCATKIRDVFEANIDGKITYNTNEEEAYTYRDLIHQYAVNKPWISDGLDIILGQKMDDDASLYDQMYIPDYLQKHLKGAMISNGESNPLLGKTKTILKFEPIESKKGIHPVLVFGILALLSIVLAYFEIKRKKPMVIFNRLILTLNGLVGCLIFFLWFLSRHSVTGENYNMLWAIPINVFIAFFAGWFYKSKAFSYYVLFLSICALIPLLFGWALPQYIPPMVYPICILLLSRYLPWYYILTRR